MGHPTSRLFHAVLWRRRFGQKIPYEHYFLGDFYASRNLSTDSCYSLLQCGFGVYGGWRNICSGDIGDFDGGLHEVRFYEIVTGDELCFDWMVFLFVFLYFLLEFLLASDLRYGRSRDIHDIFSD